MDQQSTRQLKDAKELAERVLSLTQCVNTMPDEELEEARGTLEKLCEQTTFRVVVVGMFSRGKSTFLNALIGRRLLYESDRESTGSITYLRNHPIGSVEIRSPHRTEHFVLDENSYERIRKYVDRQNQDSTATQVWVDCPMKGFDADICFVDTPGLNGLGREQAELTRQAMEQADAVIFLVLPKSLEETELKLLRGEDPLVGKIPTNNLLFVVTKIGSVLEGVSPELEEQKLDRFRREIRQQLKEHDAPFQDAPLYTVDSRDYLEAVDDAFYQQMVHESGSPSREELRRRSRFDLFQQVLSEYLEKGNRARMLQRDMTDQMLVLCDLLQKNLNEQIQQKEQDGAHRRQELLDKLDNFEKTKRHSLLKISKYIRGQIETLNQSMESDSERRKQALKQEFRDRIFRSFTRKEDFVPAQYRSLTELLRRKVDATAAELTKSINRDYQSLCRQLSQYTDQTIKATIGQSRAFVYVPEEISIHVRHTSEVSLNVAEQDLQKEIQQARQTLAGYVETEEQLQSKLAEKEREAQQRQREVDERCRRELSMLGPRPGPETKYQTKYREVKVFLWFKKEEPYQDPYLDYTRRDEYDRKRTAIQDQHRSGLEEIDRLWSECDQLKASIGDAQRRIVDVQSELGSLRGEQEKAVRRREQKWREREQKMLDGQKGELTDACEQRLDTAFRQLLDTMRNQNAKTRDSLIRTTQSLLEPVMAQYHERMMEQIDRLGQVSYEDLEQYLDSVQTLEREIEERSA